MANERSALSGIQDWLVADEWRTGKQNSFTPSDVPGSPFRFRMPLLSPVATAAAGLLGRMYGSGGEMPPAALPTAEQQQAAADAKVKADADAAAVATPDNDLDALRTSALQAVLSNPKGVSLRQLMAVSQAAPAPRRAAAIKDVAGREALNAASITLDKAIKAAGDNIPEQQKAYIRYQNAAAALAGADLQNEQFAAMLAAEREKE